MRTDISLSHAGVARDVAVVTPGSVCLHEIAAHLSGVVGATTERWYIEDRLLAADAVVGREIASGAVLRTTPGDASTGAALATIAVSSGPDAGAEVALPRGDLLVGRDVQCDLVLHDDAVSRRHLWITHDEYGVRVRELGSANGTLIDGAALHGATELHTGQLVRIGNTVLRLGADSRQRMSELIDEITLPSAAEPMRHASVPWSAAVAPLAIAPLLLLVTHSMQLAVLVLLSPLLIVVTAAAQRVRAARELARSRRDHDRELAAVTQQVRVALYDEQVVRRSRHPDPAMFAARLRDGAAPVPGQRAAIRVGVGDAAAQLRVRWHGRVESAGTVELVPTCVDLSAAELTVRAPRATAMAVLRWIAVQLACCPGVALSLEADEPHADDWHWLRWLPAFRGRGSEPIGGAHVITIADDGQRVRLRAGATRSREAPCLELAQTEGGDFVLSVGALRQTGVLCDEVSAEWAERVARLLFSLGESELSVPAHCGLAELWPRGRIDHDAVDAAWRAADHGLRAVVGATRAGPFTIDLARDGPHALVAGTTGSGKSEFLQTWVLALAARYPPDRVAFVLLDYKGGAAFDACARLPHTAAVVTDLDTSTARRALRSLRAELRRRERAFAIASARDLVDYRARGASPALPRLVVVVDEFATLHAELPDFMRGLVDVAQRGRSLGVHLVLATQRPAGVVSPEIRANVSLRVALRVTDESDSRDVVDLPGAAAISTSTPGRAIVRTADAVEQVQFAHVLGTAPAVGARVVPLDRWRQLPTGPGAGSPSEATRLVDAVAGAARTGDYSPAGAPWLPPLTARLSAEDVPRPDDPALVPIGLADLPDQQRQDPVTLDLRHGAAVAFVGSARSGRSTALRSIAVTAASRLGTAELAIHVVDCAGGALAPLRSLPHLASDVSDRDPDAISRLVGRLCAQARSQAGRTGQRHLLLVDGWSGFVAAGEEYDGGRTVAGFASLLRIAAAAGISVVVSGDIALCAARLASAFAIRFVLAQSDRADLTVAGVSGDLVPDRPGQAVRSTDGALVQLAVADEPATVRQAGARFPTELAVRALPDFVELGERTGAGGVVLGVGGDSATPIAVDLFDSAGHVLVAGPPGSGRSNALRIIGEQALRRGLDVRVAASVRSPLREWAIANQLRVHDPSDASPWHLGSCTATLVDDVESFTDTCGGDALLAVLKDPPAGLVVVASAVAADLAMTFRGPAAELRRARRGIVLHPQPSDGELFGVRLPRVAPAAPPGRGYLVADPSWRRGAAVIPIQLACCAPLSPCADSGDRSAERTSP